MNDHPGCWSTEPRNHPWHPITDMACGYVERMTDRGCAGCHRAREESPRDQLDALHGLGDVAMMQGEKDE